MTKADVEIIEVHGLYARSWKGVLNEASFVHPAKISFNLAEYIYRFAMERNMLKAGDSVLDPFGGICGTAFHAMVFGMSWYGVELEQKFVELGQANIEAWNKKYASTLPNWGSARLVQGDSRKLGEVLAEKCNGVISSPPYVSGGHHKDIMGAWNTNGRGQGVTKEDAGYGSAHGQLGNLPEGKLDGVISSPPHLNTPLTYEKNGLLEDGKKPYSRPYMDGNSENYGGNKENLGNLKEGSLDGTLDSVVSSPPYAAARIGETSGAEQVGHGANYGGEVGQLGGLKDEGFDEVVFDVAVSSPPYSEQYRPTSDKEIAEHLNQAKPKGGGAFKKYDGSQSEGNLAALDMTDGFDSVFNAALSSPPYEGELSTNRGGMKHKEGFRQGMTQGKHFAIDGYGSKENLGQGQADTFWSASKTIVSQVHSLLKPNGYAFWVVKNFVRKKQIVDFVGQWQQLCEACGFETLYEIRAWQVDEHGTQQGMEGHPDKNLKTEKISFFRRLHNQKYPETKIDCEIVLVMRKVELPTLFDPRPYHGALPEWGTPTDVKIV